MNTQNRFSSGLRTYHKHCGGAFVIGIFALLLVGAFCAFLALPMFKFQDETSLKTFTGLDFLVLSFRKFLVSSNIGFVKTSVSKSQSFVDIFALYQGDNILLKTISSHHTYFEMGIGIVFMIAVIYALLEAIFGLVMLLCGHLSKPKIITSCAWGVFLLHGLTLGLFYLYIVFYREIIKGIDGEEIFKISFSLYTLIVLGAILLCLNVVGIAYLASFKDRIFDNGIDQKESDVVISDEVNPSSNNEEIANNQQPLMKGLPENVSEIGDHAYAKDLSLKEAKIPAGISSLGAGAFANCHNLESVVLPLSLKEIGYNCFFDTPRLKTIAYLGNKDSWRMIKRGSNWLNHSGTVIVVTTDGAITVNPNH